MAVRLLTFPSFRLVNLTIFYTMALHHYLVIITFYHLKSARCIRGANASVAVTATTFHLDRPLHRHKNLSLQEPRRIHFRDRRCDRLTRNSSHRHKRLGSAKSPSGAGGLGAQTDARLLSPPPPPLMKRRGGRLRCFCRCGPHRSKLMIISLFLLSPAQLLACHAPLTRTSTQAQVSAVHSVHITLCSR